jgi:GT2 family glycosyltransferase
MDKNSSSILGLMRKALHIWAVQYHFVIPWRILKGYIHKYHTESSNISKYGQRFYDPENAEEYNKWLTFQTYDAEKKNIEVTLIGQDLDNVIGSAYPKQDMQVLDLSLIHTEYACIVGRGCHFYEMFDRYLGQCVAYDVTYFDHDELNAKGERSHPWLKPDFSYDTLRGFNYIGHCWIVKTELLKQFDGQPWDSYRWLLELSDQKISFGHISKILYGDTEPIQNEYDTLKAYFVRRNEQVSIEQNNDGVSARVYYLLQSRPLISIVIPTKDGKNVLHTCLQSIFAKTTYENYEVVIADNGSALAETKQYFLEIQEAHPNVHVFACPGPFNFSKINNQAILEHAKGEYAVLLNNDTSIITSDWLEKMLSYAQLDHIGSVGAMMYYADGSIQHAGVITGKGGGFAHRYYRKEANVKDYMHVLSVPNDVAACTAACLMVPKKKYAEVQGMNEELTVQFNDVDLAVKLLNQGYFNIFLPDVRLVHYESKSRGIDKEHSAVDRYVNEVAYAQEHYAKWIEHDPYYNDQFDKNYDYMLKVGNGSN